ncbi:MAG: hypothetical protein SGILL_009376, partial [Bacillariaceae sp.]
ADRLAMSSRRPAPPKLNTLSVCPHSAKDTAAEADQQQSEGHLPQQFAILSLLTAAAMLFLPSSPALAIDHPMDYLHLNLPNPIPDADPRYFLSGGLCAAASHGITTPIDVVKTKIQSNPVKYNDLGVAGAAQQIILDEGTGTLLRGLGPTVIGYGLEGAAKFGLYEALKPEMARLLHQDSPAIPYLIASITAGAVAALMLCPMEKTRIRLVTDPDFADNLLTGIPRLVEESGVASLFGGLGAMLSKQVPYTFAKQVTFDAFAAFLYAMAANASLAPKDVKLEVSFVAALLASILACLLSQPGDVILTKTYKNSDSDPVFADVVTEVYREQGIAGFFSGLTARFFHVGAIITSQLLLYDFIKQMLGLPATGT